MGKAARQRRLKKDKERQKRRGAPGAQGAQSGSAYGFGAGTGYEPSPRERAVRRVSGAIDALCEGNQARYESRLARLAQEGKPGWAEAVSRCLVEGLRSSVRGAWRHGWQPSELIRHIDRELTSSHASMLADMVADEMGGYAAATVDARWAAQVAGLPVALEKWGSDGDYLAEWTAGSGLRTARGGLPGTIATAVETLHELRHLPDMEKILPLPGSATARSTASRPAAGGNDKDGTPADDRMLSRIRALLAKAESTEFAEEAEALSGRAQELMAKYSIDHALLAAAEGDEETPGGRRIPVDNPYEGPKVQLLNQVGRANRCRCVWHEALGLVSVIGFEADLDAVELLFTSLLVQANMAMMRQGAKRDSAGRSRTRAFRQSFLVSYAIRIGERLSEATESAVKEASEEQASQQSERTAASGPGTALVPLLAAREQAVDDTLDEMFGDTLRPGRASRATDVEGWNSGRAAADMATLHNRDQVAES